MIKAKHNFWADKIFNLYLNRLFRNHFDAFYLLSEIPEIAEDNPLLLIPNHSTWWDGFLVYYLNHYYFRRQFFLMMLENQLSRYPFFKYVGGFGIEPGNLSGVRAPLQYSMNLLKNASKQRRLLCVFPQGELLPWDIRPIQFKKGIDYIVHKCNRGLTILPIGIRVVFMEEQRPEVFFKPGRTINTAMTKYPGSDHLAHIVQNLLESIRTDIIQKQKGQQIFTGKKSIHRRISRQQI
jgi:1-acyl-sn-glycerol-3-phosphate acyltransferase